MVADDMKVQQVCDHLQCAETILSSSLQLPLNNSNTYSFHDDMIQLQLGEKSVVAAILFMALHMNIMVQMPRGQEWKDSLHQRPR